MFKRTQDIMFSELPQLKDSGNALLSKARGDRFIWGIVILLSLISILVVYSAAGTLAYRRYHGNTEFFLFKQIAFCCVGLIIIYFVHQVNYSFFRKIAPYIFVMAIALLILTFFFGTSKNDGTRWLKIPVINITFQSSEFAKLALFVFLARFLSRKQEVIKDFKQGFLPAILPVVMVCFLIMPSNLSTAVLTGAASLLVMYLGRVKFSHLLLVLLIAGGIVAMLVSYIMLSYNPNATGADTKSKGVFSRKETWANRIKNFASNKEDSSYSQENLSKMAIASGNIFWGKGPGHSQASNFLTEAENDFIYSIIIEEYGLLGAAFILFLYIALLYRCIRIFKRCPYAFGTFLALGLGFTLVVQALANMAVSVGWVPVTGVTLPLVSMGGTSYIFTCFSIGIILSVARNVETVEGNNQVPVPVTA